MRMKNYDQDLNVTNTQQSHADGVMPKQEQAVIEYRVFDLMLLIIDKDTSLGMEGLWGHGIPQMKLRVYQMTRLLMCYLPRLYEHFEIIGLATEQLIAQWLMTLFTYTVSFPVILRLWDYAFSTGWPGIFQLSMALLQSCEESLLAMDLESVSAVVGVLIYMLCMLFG